MTNEAASSQEQPKEPIIVRSPSVPTIFAEGLSQLAIGHPISRAVFHSLAERRAGDPDNEYRLIACEIVMPTAAMIEMAHHILLTVGSVKEQLSAVEKENTVKFQRLLATDAPRTHPDLVPAVAAAAKS
jgi:hypothetical protein